MKPYTKMTKKELLNEYNGLLQSIEMTGFSSWDIAYQWQLEQEIEKRGYQLSYK